MKSWLSTLSVVSLLLVTVRFAAAYEPPPGSKRTALDDYVAKSDSKYAWEIAKKVPGNPSKTFIIKLTSQGWLTEKEVDRPTWEHWLIVVVPENATTNKAFLYIGGGGNDRPMPEGPDAITAAIAKATGSIVAELRMVPNQPLVFHGDGQRRTEDDLIGYAWDQFLKTGDPLWLPRLPMVKSAVRAMDCVQELSKQEGKPVDQFVVAGGSKRGWTTWMTGAADRRVAGIIPIVIDVVNAKPSIGHHAEVYGFWAKAIGNYYQHNILQRPDHPRMQELYEIVDPYYYLGRLTMPKLMLNATGDQFFCPDSSQFYFDDLKGDKYLRYVPNGDHSLRGTDAVETVIAFYQTILSEKPRPELDWTFEKDNVIRLKSKTKPQQVQLWQASNPKHRDFRQMTIGNTFTSQELQPEADGSYVGKVPTPLQGWTAYFIEATYDVGAPTPLKLTTSVRVEPNTLPHAGIDLKTVPYEGSTK